MEDSLQRKHKKSVVLQDDLEKRRIMFMDAVRSRRDDKAIEIIDDAEVLINKELVLDVVREDNLNVFEHIFTPSDKPKNIKFQLACLIEAIDSNSIFIFNYLVAIKSLVEESYQLLMHACKANRPQMLEVLLQTGYLTLQTEWNNPKLVRTTDGQFELRAELLETALVGKDDRQDLILILMQSSIMENRADVCKYLQYVLTDNNFGEEGVDEMNMHFLLTLVPEMVYTPLILSTMIKNNLYRCVRFIMKCKIHPMNIGHVARLISLLCKRNRPKEIKLLMKSLNWRKLPYDESIQLIMNDCIKEAITGLDNHVALLNVLTEYGMMQYISIHDVFDLVDSPSRLYDDDDDDQGRTPLRDINVLAALRAYTDSFADIDTLENFNQYRLRYTKDVSLKRNHKKRLVFDPTSKKRRIMFMDAVRSRRDDKAIEMIDDVGVVVNKELILEVVREDNLTVFKHIFTPSDKPKNIKFQLACLIEAIDNNSNFIFNYLVAIKSLVEESHQLLMHACKANRPRMVGVLSRLGYLTLHTEVNEPWMDNLAETQFDLRVELLEAALVGQDDRKDVMVTLLHSSIVENRADVPKYVESIVGDEDFENLEISESNMYYLLTLVPEMVYVPTTLQVMIDTGMYECVHYILGCKVRSLQLINVVYLIRTLAKNNRPQEIKMLLESPNCDKLPRDECGIEFSPDGGVRNILKECITDAMTAPDSHVAVLNLLNEYGMMRHFDIDDVIGSVIWPIRIDDQVRIPRDDNILAVLRSFTDISVRWWLLESFIKRGLRHSSMYILTHLSDDTRREVGPDKLHQLTRELNIHNILTRLFNRERGISFNR